MSVPFTLTGTATITSDFAIVPLVSSKGIGNVTIEAGLQSAPIAITAIDDSVYEGSEAIVVTLGTPLNASRDQYTFSETVTLTDNDTKPTLSFSSSARTLTEANKAVTATIELSRVSSYDTTFPITVSGTRRTSDYTISPAVNSENKAWITIPAGRDQTAITISVKEDSNTESTETVKVTIGEPFYSPATVGTPKTYTLTIKDDDPAPIVTTSTGSGYVANPGTLAIGDEMFYSGGGSLPQAKVIPSTSVDADFFAMAGVLAIGGPISGAVAFLDANRNGLRDFLDIDGDGIQGDDEPYEVWTYTRADGFFELVFPIVFDRNANGVIDLDEGQIVVAGGTDMSTRLPLQIPFIAPAGCYIASPLSTLLSRLVNDHGFDLETAQERVREALQLPEVDLLLFNYLSEETSSDVVAAEVFTADVKLLNAMTMAGSFISGMPNTPSLRQTTDLVVADLAAMIVAPGSILDLSSTTFMESLVNGVLYGTGLEADAGVVASAASVMAASNQYIDALPEGGDIEYFGHVVQLQTLAQGEIAQQLVQVGNGSADIGVLIDDYTGATLDDRVATANIGNLFVPLLAVTDARVLEHNAGSSMLEFTVDLIGSAADPVSVDYLTIDGTATVDGGDYHSTSGTLTWQPGDNSSKTVQVIVNADEEYESDETLLLLLANPTNAATWNDRALGTIQNDEPLLYSAPQDGQPNELSLLADGDCVSLFRNGDMVLDGTLSATVPIFIGGASGIGNSLTVELLGAGGALSGGVSFVGGSADDMLRVVDDSVETARHTVTSPASGNFQLGEVNVSYSGVESVGDRLTPSIAGLPAETPEGVTLVLDSVTPDADMNYEYEWTVTRGGDVYAVGDESDFAFSVDDEGQYTVSLTVLPEGGTPGTVVRTMAAYNVAPSVVADVSTVTVMEGQAAANSGTYADAEADLVELTASAGTVVKHNDGTWTWSLATSDGPDESQTVTMTATDSSGASTQTSFSLAVENLPPTLGGDVAEVRVAEGQIATNTGMFGDPGFDTVTLAASVGEVVDQGNGDWSWSLDTTDGPDDSQMVTVTATDSDGASVTATFSLVVNNLAPSVAGITAPLDPVPVSTTANVTASAGFTDPGTADTHTAVWTWDDGSTSPGVVSGRAVTGSHAYATPGVYQVELTVTDGEGGVDVAVFNYIVVYDPNGGFVTGGGWIMSPAGAYTLDSDLTGRANFGFVSRYKKGATVPTGTTEFQFKVADFNFHSETYQWLVVAGADAKYKGSGTINGEGDYKFMLTAP